MYDPAVQAPKVTLMTTQASQTPFFQAPNKHSIAYASKLFIAAGIVAFYYFDPSNPWRSPGPSEFIADNHLLLSLLAIFLAYEGYKLYKDLTPPSSEKNSARPARATEKEDEAWLTLKQRVALQATATCVTALIVFAYERNVLMDNMILFVGALTVMGGKLVYDLFTCYKKDKELNKYDYLDELTKGTKSVKEPPVESIARNTVLTGAILAAICLTNHPKGIEILAENWEVGLAAGLLFTGLTIAYVIYNALGYGQEGTKPERIDSDQFLDPL